MLNRLVYKIGKKTAGDKPVEITAKSRIRDAIIMTAATGIAETLARAAGSKLPPKIIKNLAHIGLGSPTGKIKLFNVKSFVPNLAAATIMGAAQGDLRNMIINARNNNEPIKDVMRKMKEYEKQFDVPEYDSFNKSAAMRMPGRNLFKMLSGAGGAAVHTAKTVGYGLLPMGKGKLGRASMKLVGRTKPFPLSHKVYGTAVKATALTGGFLGGRSVYRKIKGSGYKEDYTTFLRNNLLAGKIRPEELNTKEMEEVRELGML